ncbi:MAG: RagB/SusD family nutrient uptake outer membrane protein [Bacteroidales bacterium]|nr:RagB/SusD family nutrient uptake outer membrane protein [Bacteroidales bacterium]
MKLINKTSLLLVILLLAQTGCQKEWLDEQPLAQLSEASAWKTQSDAMLALTGLYQGSSVGENAYTNFLLCLSSATDDSSYKNGSLSSVYSGYFLYPTESQNVGGRWTKAYTSIYRCNYFLANIDKVTMDDATKKQIIAEARFLRAYEYFWIAQWYGGVPLITKVLTIKEANTQSRNTRQEIQDFVLTELTAAATDLPTTRVAAQKGRIIQSAALAVKGRQLMILKRWSEAATTFKQIIDLKVHSIDPSYSNLCKEAGENSTEIILSCNCLAGLYGNAQSQRNHHPAFYGGYQEMNPFQDLVDAFLMKDGLSIKESPLYDPDHPFNNRDPRLYASIFLPEYTFFRGTLYLGHPDLTDVGIKNLIGATGYGVKKYVTENYVGDQGSSGDDIIWIRFAEVLLGYLESKLEAGDAITQDLLDQTINQVRGRAEVSMPAVTETNKDKLREIVRNERRVEFNLERLIRWMDIHRWDIASQVINKKFYGMKLTNDPAHYTKYVVNSEGYKFVIDRTGSYNEAVNGLWPIPQSELDINSSLGQNPGY